MLNSEECGKRTAEMWERLGQQIADAVPDMVINDDPVKAIRWATCAEACFWKATGEADCHDVGDIIGPSAKNNLKA
jgi:hypothetical protein